MATAGVGGPAGEFPGNILSQQKYEKKSLEQKINKNKRATD